MIGSIKQVIAQYVRQPLNRMSASHPTMIAEAFFTVMAHQVKPRLTQPDRATGHQKSTHVLRCQLAYSIRASSPKLHQKAGCMAAISTCETARSKERLARRGASMYGSAHSPAQPTIRETDLSPNSTTRLTPHRGSGHDVLYGRHPDGKWHVGFWHGGTVAVLYPAYVCSSQRCVAPMKYAEESLI